MNHDHGMAPPPPSTNGTAGMHHHMSTAMMHMTFFWGKNAEILFSGWPGTRSGMYALALIFIFVLAFLVEWLSHSRLIKPGSRDVPAGLFQTLLHCIRVGLAYLVMLGVMSFNGGVFLAAVAGHTLGFFLFGSRVFKKNTESLSYEKHSDLPPMSC
ncbi:Ctr copper transporter [Corchorus capsularis]|uniref:Copper transport protein n=1 Tax=Corchorus capsularis TaxID=210143 RepID=A0A1R3IU64_COCAP|nr:Ctr copper transporter [Corchorus capsularis]